MLGGRNYQNLMNNYPTQPHTLSQLLGQSFRYYTQALKAIFLVIIVSMILQEAMAYFYLLNPHLSQIAQLTIYVIVILLFTYIWSVALYRTHVSLREEPVSFKSACVWVFNKISTIYLGVFAFLLGISALFFVGYGISLAASFFVQDNPAVRVFLTFWFIGIPLVIGLVLFYFVLPLLVLERLNVWQAFGKSARLVGIRIHWLRTFVVYAMTLLFILIFMPEVKHNIWLRAHHVNFLFDFVVLSLLAPWGINFILLLLNDLQLRFTNISTIPNK